MKKKITKIDEAFATIQRILNDLDLVYDDGNLEHYILKCIEFNHDIHEYLEKSYT